MSGHARQKLYQTKIETQTRRDADMKTLAVQIGIIFIAATLAVQAAAPVVAPLGALSQSLRGPARAAADASGNLYVTDPAAGCVVVFNAFGQQVAVHGGFAGPLAIAIAGDGRIYLSEEKTGSVSVFDAQWNLLYQLGAGAGEFRLPSHLAVDPASPQLVYVSDSSANLIRVYNGATPIGQFGGTGMGNGQFDFPAGLAVRSNGEVLVVDQNNDRLQVFTNGIYSRQFKLGSGGMFGGPSGRSQALIVDNAGRAFVADSFQGQVKVFDADTGSALGTIGNFGSANGQLNLPLGMVLDGFNRLCIASANNSRIELFGVDNFLHFTAQTANGKLVVGDSLAISVTVGGTNRAGFQWQKDGANLDGATNATLMVPVTDVSDSGNYSVVINGSSGTVTSSVAPVVVLAAPKILSGPVDQKLMRGETASLGVITTGSELKFQWQFNGLDLTGATNAFLLLPDAQAAQSGQYAVRVSNAVGMVLTSSANLSVVTPPLVMDIISSAAQPDQTFNLTMNVEPGFNYDLQTTTDFIQWQTVTNFAADGIVDLTDADATNYPSRYYRLSWKP
jgi:DNA-binding beta-propeller fold protein YncE